MSLEKVNQQYPCNKREGYAHQCNCMTDPHANGLNPNLFWCLLNNRNVATCDCRDCNYRENKFGPSNP